jgi:hypothetical protein
MKPTRLPVLVGLAAFLYAGTRPGQPAAVQEHVTTLQQTLRKDEARLRQYEWIETTTVHLKGKEVSRTRKRCTWGTGNRLQKVLIAASPEPKKRRGLAGWIAERRKKELTGYLQNVVEMMRLYVPPDPNRIQAAQDAGKVTLHVMQPGPRLRLEFRDYHRVGDRLGVEIDPAGSRILGMTVSTYQAAPKDVLTLNVKFGALQDGTAYPAHAFLDAKAKKTQVAVENSDLRPIALAQKLP